MSKDRMKLPDDPKSRQNLTLQQILLTGKAAHSDDIVKAAQVIRERTRAPIAVILLIYPTSMKFGSASSKTIPEKVMAELLKRVTETVQGYLAEPAKPEEENDIRPP